MLLKRIVSALGKHDVPFAVVGGYAVNLHGFVRSTVDLDILLPLEKAVYLAVEKCMQEAGLVCRVPVTAADLFDHLQRYRAEKNMKVWSFFDSGKPWEIVDFLITQDLRNFKTVNKRFEGLDIPVIDMDGLITLKREAGRPQDMEDIRALEARRGQP